MIIQIFLYHHIWLETIAEQIGLTGLPTLCTNILKLQQLEWK